MKKLQSYPLCLVPGQQLVDVHAHVTNHQSDALDEALKESFPASDPVAISFVRVSADILLSH